VRGPKKSPRTSPRASGSPCRPGSRQAIVHPVPFRTPCVAPRGAGGEMSVGVARVDTQTRQRCDVHGNRKRSGQPTDPDPDLRVTSLTVVLKAADGVAVGQPVATPSDDARASTPRMCAGYARTLTSSRLWCGLVSGRRLQGCRCSRARRPTGCDTAGAGQRAQSPRSHRAARRVPSTRPRRQRDLQARRP
jgi:hypothetical protein